MEFNEQLTTYMEELDMSVHDLAQACNMSDTVISRYKTGARVPKPDNDVLRVISEAIADYSEDRKATSPSAKVLTADEIYDSLRELLPNADIDRDLFIKRANLLFENLNISISAFSKTAAYDPSFISRVLKGQRNPSDYTTFADKLSSYAATQINLLSEPVLSDEIGYDPRRIGDASYLADRISGYLTPNASHSRPVDASSSCTADSFLEKVDGFNLDEYIRAIHFDKLKVPTIPIKRVLSKRYFGVNGLKNVDLDFLRSTALSPERGPIYMYSTVPMKSLSEDITFGKKWLLWLASVIKKGNEIVTIHDLSRPWDELMAGLEGWIPLYMTGQIHSYYLPEAPDPSHRIFTRFSHAAAVWGDCVDDDLGTAAIYMTGRKNEMDLYKKRIDAIFDKASPLMDTYRTKEEFERFLKEEMTDHPQTVCRRRMSVPPLHTMSPDLLKSLTAEANVPAGVLDSALEHLKLQEKIFNTYTENGGILNDSFPILSREQFDQQPIYAALSGAFIGMNIPYTYEAYLRHVEMTRDLSARSDNYHVDLETNYPFRNIQITVLNDKWALISKNTAPTIHFVIRHPILVDAINRFSPPVTER